MRIDKKMRTRNSLILERIEAAINLLNQKIEGIDDYPDKSLFFQDPLVFKSWLNLVKNICLINPENVTVNNKRWAYRTETYLSQLIPLRDLDKEYWNLYRKYYNKIKDLLNFYSERQEKECIDIDEIYYLINELYEKEFESKKDFNTCLYELNTESRKVKSAVCTILSDIFHILLAIMDRGDQYITKLAPDITSLVFAFDKDLKGWTQAFGKEMFEDMKEELNRHFKAYRTAPYTPELWGELLGAEEEALRMAMRQELSLCKDDKQEHWGEDMKELMDRNGKLIHLFYSSCRTDQLYDLTMDKEMDRIIDLLTTDNLSMFYEIIVRRNLIQCEMFPELKKQHEEWLNNSSENVTNEEESQTSDIPQTPNGDTTEDAIKACFKVCNEFVKGQIDKVIKEFYNGSAANLALIEIVLYDHNLLYKRNTHKAFISTLVAWELINVSNERDLNKIVNAVSDKFKRMPKEGYKSWGIDYTDDKSICENIGKKLGDTIKYNR